MQPELSENLGGVDPDVVEAAALAHDLGHPPFGHIAETHLDKLVKKTGNPDGFEGNPQSFRIVTKLALRHDDFGGLNLTRSTLNAILKYPWLRNVGREPQERKWGAYRTEEAEFNWARELTSRDGVKSPEAELMDWADDIAYALHDVEDFYRGGLIPLDRLLTDEAEVERFLERVFTRWESEGRCNELLEKEDLTEAFKEILETIRVYRPICEPYNGTRAQRAALRSMSAGQIKVYVTNALMLREPDSRDQRYVYIAPEHFLEIKILKELTNEYVINNPALATQQYGQRRLISDLFCIFYDATWNSDLRIFPPMFSEQVREIQDLPDDAKRCEMARTVSDYISGMTEQGVIESHKRLTGASLGSVLDAVVY